MKLVAMVSAMVLTASTIAPAQAYQNIGAGAASCGTWTADRRDPTSFKAFGDESWVLGFLSGVGFSGIANADPLNGMDADGIAGWIDDFCLANPIKDIASGAAAFFYTHPR